MPNNYDVGSSQLLGVWEDLKSVSTCTQIQTYTLVIPLSDPISRRRSESLGGRDHLNGYTTETLVV